MRNTEIVAVLDVLGGEVVHARRGQRERYSRIRSPLCASATPLDLARAIREQVGIESLYLADLDAIQGRRPLADAVLESLAGEGFHVTIDAGVSSVARARELRSAGAARVVVALETLDRPESLEAVLGELGADVTVFSLDLQEGVALGGPRDWTGLDPLEIAARAVESGVTHMIVLDLAAVGSQEGWPLAELCSRLHARHPGLELTSGGGLRGPGDLDELGRSGVSRALIATALHEAGSRFHAHS